MTRFIFTIILLCINFLLGHSQDSSKVHYRIIKDISQESFIYHEKYDSFISYIKEEHGSTESLNWFVGKEFLQSENSGLLLKTSSDSLHVFINNQIVDVYDKGENRMWVSSYQINSLSPKTSVPKITVYTTTSKLLPLEVFLAETDVVPVAKQPASQKVLALEKRKKSVIENYVFIVLTLMLIIVLVIRVQFPKFFTSYFSISKVIFNTTVDDQYIINKFNQPSILLVLFDTLGISLYMSVMIYKNIWDEENFILWQKWNALGSQGFVNHYLIISLLIFFSFLLKYYYLAFTNFFLKVSGTARYHYFQFKRLSSMLVTLIIPLLVVGYFAVPQFLYILDKIVIGLVLIGLFHLLIVINKSASFRNLYLISYICTTEVLPLVVFIKIV